MAGPRILIIDWDYPRPDQDSGSVSITNLVRMLLNLGFEVSYLSVSQHAEAAPYRTRLENLGVRTIAPPARGSIESFLRSHGRRFKVVVL